MAVRAASHKQARLAPEGKEWLPGREYALGAIIGGQGGEGRNSVVFRIQLLDSSGAPRRRGGQAPVEYALKMVVHLVGERRQDRAGHDRSTQLARHTGAEWREPLQLPPHECLVPVLHHYHSATPKLRNYVDPMLRDAVADKTLFLVMPLYEKGSLRSFIEARQRQHPHPPYGLGWVWFGNLLLRMCRAVGHLIAADEIHGDIKDDNFFIDDDGGVVLGDFGTAWALLDEDGVELRLTSRNDLLEKRAGVGRHKAPEVRGRAEARDAPLLRDVYAKAEGFSVGVVMYGLLEALQAGDVFDRLADTMLDEERRYERGDPPSKPDDPFYGRRQPGWIYTSDELPALPGDMPGWLAEVVVGLVKSDDCPEEERLTPAEAIALLEVQGVAQTWEKLDAARRELEQQRLQVQQLMAQHEAEMQSQEELKKSIEERLAVERALQADLADAAAAKAAAEAAAAQALVEKQAVEREMEERKNRRRQRAEAAEAAAEEAQRQLAAMEALRGEERTEAARQIDELRSASEAEAASQRAETARLKAELAASQDTHAALQAAREAAEAALKEPDCGAAAVTAGDNNESEGGTARGGLVSADVIRIDGSDVITIDGSDDPTLQQFIDRVNAALRDRDDVLRAAVEPETFYELCVTLGISEQHNYLVAQSVDSSQQLLMLAGHGLKKSDCEEIGIDEARRDNILNWAKQPSVGITVGSVSIERQALWHPIVYTTNSNLPRKLSQLLHEASESGLENGGEIKVDVHYSSPLDGKCSTGADDGPIVMVNLCGSAGVSGDASNVSGSAVGMLADLPIDASLYATKEMMESGELNPRSKWTKYTNAGRVLYGSDAGLTLKKPQEGVKEEREMAPKIFDKYFRHLLRTDGPLLVAEPEPVPEQEPVSVRPTYELNKTDNAYKNADKDTMADEEVVARDSRNVLNKLTWEKFDHLLEKWLKIPITTPALMTKVIEELFVIVLLQSHFAEVYAEFCCRVAEKFNEEYLGTLDAFQESDATRKMTFKRMLLTQCQKQFEAKKNQENDKPIVRTDFPEGREGQDEFEIAEKKRWQESKKAIGNLIFIGELYKKRMLNEHIMHTCLVNLVKGAHAKAEQELVECLCKLLATIGSRIDTKKSAQHMKLYFGLIQSLSKDDRLDMRLRFMLKDLIELRANWWRSRRKEDKAKKISEIHADIKDEERQQESRQMQRGGGGGRRGSGIAKHLQEDEAAYFQGNMCALTWRLEVLHRLVDDDKIPAQYMYLHFRPDTLSDSEYLGRLRGIMDVARYHRAFPGILGLCVSLLTTATAGLGIRAVVNAGGLELLAGLFSRPLYFRNPEIVTDAATLLLHWLQPDSNTEDALAITWIIQQKMSITGEHSFSMVVDLDSAIEDILNETFLDDDFDAKAAQEDLKRLRPIFSECADITVSDEHFALFDEDTRAWATALRDRVHSEIGDAGVDAMQAHGNQHFKGESLAAALQCYEAALVLDADERTPVNPARTAALYSNRSACCFKHSEMTERVVMKLKWLKEAAGDATRCVQADPTFVRGWLRKGMSHAALGQLEDAKAAFEAGLELDLDNKQLRKQLKMLQQGMSPRPPIVDAKDDAALYMSKLYFSKGYGDVGISADGSQARGGDEGGMVVCEQPVMSEGVHMVVFPLGADPLVIGVVDADFDFGSGFLATNTESGWGYFSGNGKLMHASFTGIAWEGMQPSTEKDMIELKLDCTTRTLTVHKNGVTLGVMCSGVGDDCRGLLWMAQLHDGAIVQIIGTDHCRQIIGSESEQGRAPGTPGTDRVDTPLQEGMVGQVWGLESETGRLLNGKLCKVGRFDDESKRHTCQLLAMSEGRWVTNKYEADKKRVKPCHLRPFHSGLFEAVQAGDQAGLVALLMDHKYAVDTFIKDRSTALIEAAHGGDATCAMILLAAGANPNMQCLDGTTALMLASIKGDVNMARLLLAPDAVLSEDSSLRRWLLEASRYQMMRELTPTAGAADSNLRQQQGGTALHMAATNGHAEAVKLLVEHGADVNAAAANGNTALMMAALNSAKDVLTYLVTIDGIGLNAGNTTPEARGTTALHLACANADLGSVKLLVAAGCDAAATCFHNGADGVTATQLALACGPRGVAIQDYFLYRRTTVAEGVDHMLRAEDSLRRLN